MCACVGVAVGVGVDVRGCVGVGAALKNYYFSPFLFKSLKSFKSFLKKLPKTPGGVFIFLFFLS